MSRKDPLSHSLFYEGIFDPEGSNEEDGKTSKEVPMVKSPVKNCSDGDESRSHVTNCEMHTITHFHIKDKNILTSIFIFKDRVIKPKAI